MARTWLFKPSTGDFWVLAKPCKKRTCPICVVPALTRTAVLVWAFWGGRWVSVVELTGTKYQQDRRVRVEPRIRMRHHRDPVTDDVDEPATAGALKVPGADGSHTIFWPATSSTALRGQQLDQRLVAAIRAVPITEDDTLHTERKPSDTAGAIPIELSEARGVAEDLGFDWGTFNAQYGHASGVTPEMVVAFRDRLWAKARSATVFKY